MQKQNFLLKKWYFDAIGLQGDLAIAYAADIHWKKIRVSFSSLLYQNKSLPLKIHNSLKASELPGFSNNIFNYSNPLFNITLDNSVNFLTKKLYDGEGGFIEWNCYYPSSNVSLDSRHISVKARGYAEELVTTLAPRKMKIRELWWGRFISEKNYITWIHWKGDWQRFFIWNNEQEITAGSINEQRIEFDNCNLVFANPEILRSGSVMNTAFKGASLIKKFFPFKVLSDETTWTSTGNLYEDGVLIATDDCIYEKMTWHE